MEICFGEIRSIHLFKIVSFSFTCLKLLAQQCACMNGLIAGDTEQH